MKLLRMLALLMAATLLLGAALAETDEGFGFDFDDDGYTGEWLELTELGIEFCLPDGWAETEGGDGAAFAAADGNGTAALEIRVEAEAVEDIVAWGDANLAAYQVDTTGFYDTLYVESDDVLTVYHLNDRNQVLAFAFTRTQPSALTRDFALEIVGSVSESWMDEGLSTDDETDLLAQIQALEDSGE